MFPPSFSLVLLSQFRFYIYYYITRYQHESLSLCSYVARLIFSLCSDFGVNYYQEDHGCKTSIVNRRDSFCYKDEVILSM